MTSSNGNIFRVTGPFGLEFAGDRWIRLTKAEWRGALVFSLICAWINGRVNSHEAGDLRRHRAHYDVIVKICSVWLRTPPSRLLIVKLSWSIRDHAIRPGHIDNKNKFKTCNDMYDILSACTIHFNQALMNNSSKLERCQSLFWQDKAHCMRYHNKTFSEQAIISIT